MCRPFEDIIASEDRISWRTVFNGINLRAEEEKYKQFAEYFDANDPICVKKYKVLFRMQEAYIQNLIILDYESMKIHPTWKDKKDRKDHSWDETE